MYIQFCNFYEILKHYVKDNSIFTVKDNRNILFDHIFASYTKIHPVNPDSIQKMINNYRGVKQEIPNFYAKVGIQQLSTDILEHVFPDLVSPRAFADQLHRNILFDPDLVSRLKSRGIYKYPEEDSMALAQYIAETLFIIISREHFPSTKHGMPNIPQWISLDGSHRLVSKSVPSPSSYFVGRSKELQRLHNMLEEKHTVYLWGVHGIGKSELVYKYCEVYQSQYTHILYIHSTGNLRADLCTLQIIGGFPHTGDMFHDLAFALRCLQKDTLLIIDNMNTIPLSESGWAEVQQCGCKLLVTTRCKPQGPDTSIYLELEEIKDMRSLIALVKAISQKKNLNPEILRRIIKTLHKHTTAVVLLAMLLEKGRYTTGEIHRKLYPRKLKDFIKETICFRYREDNFLGHLRTLFHLFQFEGLERDALKHMVLIPETGIPLSLFEHWTELHDTNTMNGLLKHGMVCGNHFSTDQSHHYLVSLKPIIRELAWEEFTPSLQACATLIRNSANAMHLLTDDETAQYLLQLSQEVMVWVEKDDIPVYINYLHKSFELAARQNQDTIMENIVNALSAALEKSSDPSNIDKAMLEDYRATLEKNPTTAIQHRHTAISMLDPKKKDENRLKADILDRIAGDYAEKRDWSKAKQYSDMSCTILLELCPLEIPDIFSISCRRGAILCHTGAAEEGLNLLHQMESFVQMYEPQPTLNRVAMQSSLAEAYRTIGDIENAKKYQNLYRESFSLLQKRMGNTL